ncbi:BglG family transcription antiterminator [Inconstantimicrobium porci]|uniref:BglG family transcription antiterminator n=1 Tax=Inconstantimicrobium porci TaxID=2652291 RepID=UPI00240A0C7C|nr:PRD domain-containing protein [Inconstantimicrobium porci]MDD6770902.1 PRD domain-containing protein [Inconstantimicrobium porci]
MLSNKERTIMNFFVGHQGELLTSKDIAENLKLSDRTVRSYIKRLQVILQNNGADIIAKTGCGYRLFINNEPDFNTFLKENTDDSLKKNETVLEGSKDRQYHILNKLLFEDAYVLFDDLCDELYVSRSTLSNDFSEIRKLLEPYNLSVESKVKKGVYIKGDEHQKRHFIMDYFFSNNFSVSINKYVGDTLFLDGISFEEITIIVLDECREAGLRLSDYIIQNLVLHIALLIKRIKSGFSLSKIEIDKSVECSRELEVAGNILKRIIQSGNIEIPEEEAYYIALHLKVKCISKSLDEKSSTSEKEITKELISILDRIEKDTGYLIKNDEHLIKGLISHFYTLCKRLQHDVILENPLLEEIKQKYGEILLLTKKYLKDMSIFKNYNVSDGEWAYICLHFMAAIERFRNTKKFNVLVICATGYGSSQMLNVRLKKEFGQHINVVDVIGYYEITNEKLKGIDLIVSTIDLYTIVFNVPVIHVSVFLNNNDISHIKTFIDYRTSGNIEKPKNVSSIDLNERSKLFDKFFNKDSFLIIDGSDSKENIINKLVEKLQANEDSSYSMIMTNQIKQREQMSSVVFGKHVAVPHPAKAVGKFTQIAVAIVKGGVNWENEYNDIKFIFLLSPSKIENVNLRNITNAIASMIESDCIQNEILKCNTFSEFEEKFMQLIK